MRPYNRYFIQTKTAFSVTLLVILLTVVFIWLFGLGRHRTLFINSILSITTLSVAFFFFLFAGLYHGIKLRDNVGKITDRIRLPSFPDSLYLPDSDTAAGEGCAEVIGHMISWLLFSVLLLIVIWLFGALLWTLILVFAAMLYWIFFRALRLVFKRSAVCKGRIGVSAVYAIAYTFLYSFWIYCIIILVHLFMYSEI